MKYLPCYWKYPWPLWPLEHVERKWRPLWNQNKTVAWRSIFALVFCSYSWKIPVSTLKRHRGKQLLCEVYCLIFRIRRGEANRCNRFLVAEVRNHEGKPYFRDIEKKVWLFYEVNCDRKAPSKTGFSPHCFRLKYGSNLTWTQFLMIVSRVNATKCELLFIWSLNKVAQCSQQFGVKSFKIQENF